MGTTSLHLNIHKITSQNDAIDKYESFLSMTHLPSHTIFCINI